MKLAIGSILLISLLSGCAHQSPHTTKIEEQTGKWEWVHADHYTRAMKGEITWKQVDHYYSVDMNTCKIQSLQLPIPSPACSTIAAPDCRKETGFSLGACRAQTSYQKCDYSSVDSALDAQKKIKESCMNLKGWELELQDKEVVAAQPSKSLVEIYLGPEADAMVLKMINSANDGLVDDITSRWTLIRSDERYVNGSEAYRLSIRDEYFEKRMAATYPANQRAWKRYMFEKIDLQLDAIAAE